ncbi:Na+/H+ antiporter NhaA [Xylanimonas ulmi]|uniref:Na(+)/H(+) antiporter NhaA n=1 Tax=Xylanimonas ulmi TaxID=228973 RepID=A0A4V2EXP4_9MICO|nr:Na+/H+ antiporter NhaA [Xylanibacterium ulmi]RZS60200.1 sodium/proton antiporter (NhaA family) [Xylanibacterium ulmi]
MTATPIRLRGAVSHERLQRLSRSSAAAAGALLLATLCALVWANVPGGTYDALWHAEAEIAIGGAELRLDLRHWVNDGLMTLFFLLVSLEVKHAFALGELRDRARARLPVFAAVAGLIVPALLFLVVMSLGDGDPRAVGAWGAVISTDTAFALGLLALVGRSAPPALRLFILTLAVVDDVGALAVVAVAFTDDLAVIPMAVAALALVGLAVLSRIGVWRGPVYLAVAVVAWLAFLASGVHATVAGVAIGLVLPVHAPRRERVQEAATSAREFSRAPNPRRGRDATLRIARAVSVNERLQTLFGPYVNLLVVPVFALANAGVVLDGPSLLGAATSTLTWAVVVGLVVGKFVGVVCGVGAALALGAARLAPGLHVRHVAAAGAISGMGFTISLFIVDLSLDDAETQSQARIGVLAATVVAAALSSAVFAVARRRDRRAGDETPRLLRPVDPARDHLRGPADAPSQLVVYASFAYSTAGRFEELLDELRERLGDRLLIVFRHLPTADPVALEAAQASEAAASQGRFWEMRDALARAGGQLTSREVRRCAARAGLNVDRVEDAVQSGRHLARVTEDAVDAEAIGSGEPPQIFVNDRLYQGPVDIDDLEAQLESAPVAPAAPQHERQVARRARPTVYSW